ncbi:L-serine ammonia-lyase, iron-sulfur-dependent, subunit alpha [Flavilitoribacter nigricans]|uniref:L-serine ammonia-lyase n=1 Tax=Flavilitoribacter nigricans (strain ATCC 23147 / DSM 23189 / NBRC 102662 / NCIMB 1420 / SS-2) TaxID=1122177 RepID=A0A2D0NJM4_FLAN2|nr:L-serine ammonia-lyase, iron-sulfur-dependent, subunit alpha [Flavilitoribacter nigricans]PHN08657.1 serine dehydratase [Flavilitoribacter nigricans DSM 23189 = NBRC 102662]
MKVYPSIFNDVLGPVMRGPSSSHCAAALRIGRICRDLMDGRIDQVLIYFDPNGSLATTHKSQGSDMGLFGGLLGWEADDERLPDYERAIAEAGIDIRIHIEDIGADHPNTYKISLFNDDGMRELTANSTGGGMIEVIEIDGAPVRMDGDYFETLVYVDQPEKVQAYLQASVDFDDIVVHRGRQHFIQIKSQAFLPDEILAELHAMETVLFIKQIAPVLPVMSRNDLEVPFITCEEMLAYNEDKNLSLWELGLQYESARGNISTEEVYRRMQDLVRIMSNSIGQGLKGTEYEDRILGSQSTNFQKQLDQNKLIHGDVLNRIILFVSAMMEVKSSMGVIVAAPTAGSCGALPGAVLGAASAMELSEDETVKAMLAAGMIGIFISAHATFAAEVGGCQAECGSGSGMAAAGLVGMAGGDLKQSLSAASMALQNSLGMICDPIANRVEAPCLGRNIMAATNALSCANMALADYDHLIPIDEVIETMDQVGKSIANELRCTALGGLSITKTSKAIEARLNAQSGTPEPETLEETRRRFKIC